MVTVNRETGEKFQSAMVIASRETSEELVPYACGYCQHGNR